MSWNLRRREERRADGDFGAKNGDWGGGENFLGGAKILVMRHFDRQSADRF